MASPSPVLLLLSLLLFLLSQVAPLSSLKIALINPLTGPRAIYGNALLNAQILAIEELNQNSPWVNYVSINTQSSTSTLLSQFNSQWGSPDISDIFVSCTSSERKKILETVSSSPQPNKQIWYPLPFEGQECSQSMWYVGGNTNSQLHTCYTWALEQSNFRILFVGLNQSILSTNYLASIQNYSSIYAVSVQTYFVDPSSKQWSQLLSQSIQNFAQSSWTPNNYALVINGLNDANPEVVSALYNEVQNNDKLKLLSFMDSAFSGLTLNQTDHHLDCISYWKGSNSSENSAFTARFLQRYPETQSHWNISSEQEQAYMSIKLWAFKAQQGKGLGASLYNQEFNFPEGNITTLSSHQIQRKYFIVSGPNSTQLTSSPILLHSFSTISKIRSQPWDRYRNESREYNCDWSLNSSQIKPGDTPGHFQMPTIRVGVLHSSTGSLAISETAVIRADILAIDQFNDQGGISGSYVLPFFRDGASDSNVFAAQAEALILEDEVVCIFGCWTSSSRKAVEPIVEKYKSQLYYPVQYEGSECNEHVFYGGATPNQQLEPAIHWALWDLSTDFFLVGSDYVYPRTSNKIAQNYIRTFGGVVHGEEYAPLNDTSPIPGILTKISKNLPAKGCILNTLNGEANVEFFRLLPYYNITPETHPIISFSITEQEVQTIGVQHVQGHYASWNYFMSIENEENVKFVQLFQNYYGDNVLTNDPMEASWILIHLWKMAVERSGSTNSTEIRSLLYGQTYQAPENVVEMNTNHHLSKWARIGRVNSNGQFDLVLSQNVPITPEPWDSWLPDEVGYSCDFFDPSHGSKYAVDQVWIGILHSLTGTLSLSERPIVDTHLMAIDQINAAGGVNGMKVFPLIANGASNWTLFEELAWNLTLNPNVTTVFGCWTSASRKQVLPVFRSTLKTLWYPVQYEGQECEEQVFYGGATPNQQIEPAVDWWIRRGCTNMFLIGSDYVFPRTANQIINAYCESHGCFIRGEVYIKLGDKNVSWVLEKIVTENPEGICIFNTLNGDTNVAMFQAMPMYNMTAENYPTMSVSIGEPEVNDIGVKYLQGHFASWNYFQSVGNGVNDSKPNPSSDFVDSFQGRYGSNRVVSDPMEAAYILINIWKQAAETAGVFDDAAVHEAALYQGFDAPEGYVTMGTNHHLTKVVRIGQVNEHGQFDILYEKDNVAAQPWNQNIANTTGYICDHSVKDGTFFQPPEVKIGIIQSFSGPLNSSLQRAYVDSFQLAIDQWNQVGGVAGQMIVPILKDDRSDEATFVELVNEFLDDPSVVAIFGGSSQVAIDQATPLLAQKRKPLFSPVEYLDAPAVCNSAVFYSSPTPEQELYPTIQTFEQRSKTMFFLVGMNDSSTQLRVQVAEKIIDPQPLLNFSKAFLLNEDQLTQDLDSLFRSWWTDMIDMSSESNGAVILNYFPSGSPANPILFQSFSEIGLSKSRYPIVSFRLSVPEISKMNLEVVQDHMIVSNYFSGLSSLISQNYDQKMIQAEFVTNINELPTKAQDAFTLFSLWATGVQRSSSFDLDHVRQAMYRTIVEVPQGQVFMEMNNRVATAYFLAKIGKFLTARVIYPTGVDTHISTLLPTMRVDFVGEFSRITQLNSIELVMNENVLGCDMGPTEVVLDYSKQVKTVVYVFSFVGLGITFIFTVLVLALRNDRIIRAASVPFLLPILGSLSLGFVAGILLATPPAADNIICSARIWVLIIGGMSTLSFLLIKNWRLFHIFNNSLQVKRKIVISTRILFLEVGVIMLIQVAFLILWTGIDQSTFSKTLTTDQKIDDNFDGEITYIPHCTVSTPFLAIQFIYSALLLIAGTVLSWKLKELPTNYNESKYVGFAIFLIVFFCIILIPINFLLNTDQQSTGSTNALVIIRGLGTTIATLIILFVIFMPKFIMMKTLTSSPGTGSNQKPSTGTPATEIEAV